MKITVVGTGYVGLVTGTCFAEINHKVICVDIDEAKINCLKNSEIPIYEPHLDHLVKRNISANRLSFTTDLKKAVEDSEIIFIAVGTPPNEDGSADLKNVLLVAEQIAKAVNGYKVIVNKSTVPVGTGQKVTDLIKQTTRHPFDVVSNPEFLREGCAIDDFLKPDRIVVGTETKKAWEMMNKLYEPLIRINHPIIKMDIKSAEMTKYVANAMLANRISFMNEMAEICEKVGADIELIRQGIATDHRVGRYFLHSGIGYGGSCFPKDVKAIIQIGKEKEVDMSIMEAIEKRNEKQKRLFVDKIITRFGKDLKDKIFAIWGIAFKPETDDIREAPAITIAKELLAMGASIQITDPEAMEECKKQIPAEKNSITYFSNKYEALKNADTLIVCTEWHEYIHPDFHKMSNLMKNKIIYDGRNIWKNNIHGEDFEWTGVGN